MKKQAGTLNALEADNGGRRLGAERRRFSYTYYIPERRKGQDRRNGKDRRTSLQPRISSKTLRPRQDDTLDQNGIPT
jgi:hypothetical protein